MKTFLTIMLAVLPCLAWAQDETPLRSNLVLRIIWPTDSSVFITTNHTIRLAGIIRPAGTADIVMWSSSTGFSGPCRLLSNTLWNTPPIPLAPGSRNLITVISINSTTHALACDAINVLRVVPESPSNHPPRIVSLPRRLWGTNMVYHYVLKARDPDGDLMRLQLKTAGPVETTVHRIDEGTWLISAILTDDTRKVGFKAYVSDGKTRPARQCWAVYLPPTRQPAPEPLPE